MTALGRYFLASIVGFATFGCQSKGETGLAAKKLAAKTVDALPKKIDRPGIDNLYQLAEGLYSGAQPTGDTGFETLAKLGVKTLIDVDGNSPDVERARKVGIRCIHIPIGYDGIKESQALHIVKAASALPGPIFVHCHHGQHRGPSAAAVVCIAEHGWTSQQALAWLNQAGTSPSYAGLFRDVGKFKAPSPAELDKAPSDFPEKAKVAGLVPTMLEIDVQFDDLKRLAKTGFKKPTDSSQLGPSQDASLLVESFREIQRREDAKNRSEEFLPRMQGAEATADNLRKACERVEQAPTDDNRRLADSAVQVMEQSCTECHARFRNK